MSSAFGTRSDVCQGSSFCSFIIHDDRWMSYILCWYWLPLHMHAQGVRWCLILHRQLPSSALQLMLQQCLGLSLTGALEFGTPCVFSSAKFDFTGEWLSYSPVIHMN